MFVFDDGLLDETDVAGMVFPVAEIISAGSHARRCTKQVKPVLADSLDAAAHAVEQDVTALCEQGRRIA